MNNASKDNMDIKPLTAFRFFAAFYVFLRHCISTSGTHGGLAGWFNDVFIAGGYSGVTFFYILSGFILTYKYNERMANPERKVVAEYFVSRVARIYPVHILTFIACVPLFIWLPGAKLSPVSVFLNITLTQAFSRWLWGDFNSISWSLSAEMFFYLLLPGILWSAARMKAGFSSQASWRRFIIGATFAFWAGAVAAYMVFIPGLSEKNYYIYIFPPARLLEFVLGVFLGLIFITIDTKKMRTGAAAFTAIEAFSIIILMAGLTARPHVDTSLQSALFFVPFYGLLIYAFAFQRGALSGLLSGRVMQYLGNISFSFYMSHSIVLRYFSMTPLHRSLPGAAQILIAFVLTMAARALLYEVFETPMRKKARAFAMKRIKAA